MTCDRFGDPHHSCPDCERDEDETEVAADEVSEWIAKARAANRGVDYYHLRKFNPPGPRAPRCVARVRRGLRARLPDLHPVCVSWFETGGRNPMSETSNETKAPPIVVPSMKDAAGKRAWLDALVPSKRHDGESEGDWTDGDECRCVCHISERPGMLQLAKWLSIVWDEADEAERRAEIYSSALREITEPSVPWSDPFPAAQRVARQALARAASRLEGDTE